MRRPTLSRANAAGHRQGVVLRRDFQVVETRGYTRVSRDTRPVPTVPDRVLDAFGLSGAQVSLAGGMGGSVLVRGAVLKPDGDDVEATWLGNLQHRLHADGVRTPRPLQAADGRWVVDGWTAAAYLPGTEQPDRWGDVIAASRPFHHALAHEPRPALLDARTHRWAHADRVAWSETDQDLGVLGQKLTSRYADVHLPSQLVHCDLSGNMLFHDVEPPAVIDLSLYWRPVPYAEAIVAVDAYLWYDAGPEVLDLIDHPDARQLLLRATVFRLTAEMSPEYQGERSPTAYERLTDALATR